MTLCIVPKEHIDALIRAGLHISRIRGTAREFSWKHDRQKRILRTRSDANDVGKMLWMENFKSLASRYPAIESGIAPYPDGYSLLDAERYTYSNSWFSGEPSPVRVLKALQGYEAQMKGTHPTYLFSEAHTFCRVLEREMIELLDGYDEATFLVNDVRQILGDSPLNTTLKQSET